ncbi:protein kinase domain-containing protein [Nocardiopsis baichengensis]|uniref:protein kinase domain-containing protein n=1 Tax=Nocardiopsis baichengensis TaxID=280240 RepID=UPI00037FCD30|nr:protein kinase [Nocardiopsis baichengensis]
MLGPLRDSDPRRIGPYRIRARLGAGGMGEVFLGRSKGGRPVAVKVVRDELADDRGFLRRFGREVEAARRVGGHYTAQVVDADTGGTPPWFATAYIAGPSLQWAVDRHGPLPAGSVTALGAGLAEGLATVHAKGLVHRDLKPGNVILAGDGPRLIDFGIARAMDSTSYTQSRSVLGTPAFMSPEQARGEETGPASDVFSLGSVLAYAVTGTGPFGAGAPHAVTYRIVHEPPVLDGVPGALGALVRSCLEKRPEGRPSTDEVLDALSSSGEAGQEWADGQWVPEAVTEVITLEATRALTLVGAGPSKAGPKGGKQGRQGPKPQRDAEPKRERAPERKAAPPPGSKSAKKPISLGATKVNWGFTAVNFRGRHYERFTATFPPGGTKGGGKVKGTSVYTDDSSVGHAAVHAGLITLKHGGTVTFEIRPGEEAYAGSLQHGVVSGKAGRSPGSFVFPKAKKQVAGQRPPSSVASSAPKAATAPSTSGSGTAEGTASQNQSSNGGWWLAAGAAVLAVLLYGYHPGFSGWANQWVNSGTDDIQVGDCIDRLSSTTLVEVPCFSAAASLRVAALRPMSQDSLSPEYTPVRFQGSTIGRRHVCQGVDGWTEGVDSDSTIRLTDTVACVVLDL